jgi:hypothetical protein
MDLDCGISSASGNLSNYGGTTNKRARAHSLCGFQNRKANFCPSPAQDHTNRHSKNLERCGPSATRFSILLEGHRVHSTRKTSSLPPDPDTLGVRTYGHCRETSDRDWDLVTGARHGGPYLKSLHEVDPVLWTPICLSFGVHDVKEAPIQEQAPPLCAGVPSADGRAGPGWSHAGATGEEVRAIGASNPQTGLRRPIVTRAAARMA